MDIILITKKNIKKHDKWTECAGCEQKFKVEVGSKLIIPPPEYYAGNFYFCRKCAVTKHKDNIVI